MQITRMFRAVVLAVVVAALMACEGNDRAPFPPARSSNAHDAESVEFKLAVVDTAHPQPDELVVARFRSLLRQLGSRYGETDERIASMTVVGHNLLKKEGVRESLLTMMEGFNQIPAVAGQGKEFAEYVAMYVELRKSGRSHTAALQVINGALHELGIR